MKEKIFEEILYCKYCKCQFIIFNKRQRKNRYCSKKCSSKCSSPYTLIYWLAKGFSEEEAHIKIKERRSFNIEFWLAKGFSEEEAKIKLSQSQTENGNKFAKKRKEDPEKYKDGQNTNIEYYLKKTDGNVEEAEALLKERQATGRLDKFQERYGEEDGQRRWEERQIQWQNTLKTKPIKEIERINRAKLFKNSYSKMSQELFWMIYEEIKFYIKDVRFATIKNGKKIIENSEYIHVFLEGNATILDFLIEKEKINIEFDGEYWHTDEVKIKDKIRDENLFKEGFKILRINELDWLDNKKNVLIRCLEFINENTNQRLSRVLREISRI